MKFGWISALVLSGSLQTFANTEYPRTSSRDGGNPYLLVMEDGQGPSQRAPGVYVPRPGGSWRLAIPGQIHRRGAILGILYEFNFEALGFNGTAKEYETLTLIGDKLYVFDQHADHESGAGLAHLGGPLHSLFDPISGRNVELGSIVSLEDVSITATNVTAAIAPGNVSIPAGISVIVSVRQNLGILGDGVTFAFVVDSPERRGSSTQGFPLRYQPVVLDYRFRTERELATFLKTENSTPRVFSAAHAQRCARPAADDPPTLRRWRERVQRSLSNNQIDVLLAEGAPLPVLDLRSGVVVMSRAVTGGVTSCDGAAVGNQEYNPLGGEGTERFTWEGNGQFTGRLRVLPSGAYLVSGLVGTQPLVGFSQRELVEFAHGVRLELAQDRHKNLVDLAASHFDVSGNPGTRYIFVSEKYQDGSGSTHVYVISLVAPGSPPPRLIASHKLMDLWIPRSELVHRMAASATVLQPGATTVMFDNVTPSLHEDAEALQRYVEDSSATRPMLDVSYLAQAGATRMAYRKALKEILLDQGLTYYEFDESPRTPTSARVTGVYSNTGERVIGGRLLTSAASPEPDHLAQFDLSRRDSPGRKLTVRAFDPERVEGRAGFNLVITMSRGGIAGTAVEHQHMEVRVPAIPFAALKYVSFIPDRRNNDDRGVLVVGFQNESLSKVLFIPTYLTRAGDVSRKPQLSTGDQSWIETPEPGFSSVINRLVINSRDGALLLVVNPALARTDANFALRNLFTAKPETPSVGGIVPSHYQFASDLGQRPDNQASDASRLMDFVNAQIRVDQELIWTTAAVPPETVFAATELRQITDRGAKVKELLNRYPDVPKIIKKLVEGERGRHTVILANDDQTRKEIKQLLYFLYTGAADESSPFNGRNGRVRLHPANTTSRELSSVVRNLRLIRSQRGSEHRIVIADLGDYDGINNGLISGAEDDGLDMYRTAPRGRGFFEYHGMSPDEEIGESDPHLLYLLASGGEALPVDALNDRTAGSEIQRPYSSLVFSTLAEWGSTVANLREGFGLDVESVFHVESGALLNPWALFPPHDSRLATELQPSRLAPANRMDRELFPEIFNTLEDLARGETPAKHHIFVVDDSLGPHFRNLMFSSWLSQDVSQAPSAVWTHRNPNLDVTYIPSVGGQLPSQINVQKALGIARRAAHYRPGVVIGSMSDVLAMRRPALVGRTGNESNTAEYDRQFQIRDIVQPAPGTAVGEDTVVQTIPHALWLLASEGRSVQPADFIRPEFPGDRRLGMVLVTTRSQFRSLQAEIEFESRFGLLDRFQVTEVSAPSSEVRKASIAQLLVRPELQALGLTFDAGEGVVGARARERLAAYLVSRSEQYAPDAGRDPTEQFLALPSRLLTEILRDPELRRTKVVNAAFMDRLLSKIYGVIPSIESLAPNDPWRILNNRRAFTLALGESGRYPPYEANQPFLEKFHAMMSRNLREHSSARVIPNAQVHYGDPATGKSFLIRKTLVDVLHLNAYDFSSPDNTSAQYIWINGSQITAPVGGSETKRETKGAKSENPSGGEAGAANAADLVGTLMTAEQFIDHVHNLLAQPFGDRAYIVLDDLHKMDGESLQRVIAFLGGLLDAPDGIYRFLHKATGSVREIPVRNLTPIITMNLPDDQDVINRFRSTDRVELHSAGGVAPSDDIALLNATLAQRSTGNKSLVDRSFWTRFGALERHRRNTPRSAQFLRDFRTRTASRHAGSRNQQMLLPVEVAERIFGRFPNADSREAPSAGLGLISLLEGRSAGPGSYVFVPAARMRTWQSSPRGEEASSGRLDDEIQRMVKDEVLALRVAPGEHQGQLMMLESAVDTFRTLVFQNLVRAFTNDPALEDPQYLNHFVAPSLFGWHWRLHNVPQLRVGYLRLDAVRFGSVNVRDRDAFARQLATISGRDPEMDRRQFPVRFASDFSNPQHYSALRGDRAASAPPARTRAHVLSSYAQTVEDKLQRLLLQFLHVPNLDQVPPIETWVRGLPERDDATAAAFRQVGQELVELYLAFARELDDNQLTENLQRERYLTPAPFDRAVLFSIVIDRALTRLSWSGAAELLTQVLSHVVGNIELSQHRGWQYYAYESDHSALASVPKTRLLALMDGLEAFRLYRENPIKEHRDRVRQLPGDFVQNCERYLVQSQVSE